MITRFPSSKTRAISTAMARTLTINSKAPLNSGYEIPVLGYGVFRTPADTCETVVTHALKTGYRHIDSAAFYQNEGACAQAIVKSGIPREEIFFTSKIPPPVGYAATKAQIERTLATTKLPYMDLMLLHAPWGGIDGRKGAWRAMVEAQEAGKIRSLGVSNFGVHHLNELETFIKELEAERGGKGKGGVISVGQWEIHPWLARPDIVSWCKERGVVVEAYSPLVKGQKFNDPLLKSIAAKHGKSEAQILLRWSLQMGLVPLPKSETPNRIEGNAAVFGWQLDEEDMKKLDTGAYETTGWDPTVSPLSQ